MSASNQILDAVELLTENLIKKAAYDKTIQAQIISCEDQTIGKYKCRYQDAIIYAYSNSIDVTYNEKAYVYILVPDNDMSKEKTILGTVNRLGINYISQAEGEQAYDTVGKNCIESKAEFSLNTEKNNSKIIYLNNNENNNLITIDSQINNYITQSSSLLIGALFRTNIKPEKQYKGHYGIQFNLRFQDNQTNTEVVRTYILDQDSMIGNPYRLIEKTRQYQIFDIDGQNFKEIESIKIFCQDFDQVDNSTADIESIDDIFISSLQFIGMNRIEENEINGVSISFITPRGIVFDNFNKLSELSILAQVKVKGKIASSVQKIPFYWGRENAGIFADSENYNKYLGKGWQCLNDKNIIRQKDEKTNTPTVEWVPAGNTYIVKKNNVLSKDNKFKVAILYENNIITKEITIYNQTAKKIIIQSNNGTQFYYDNGHPTLTCKIDGKQELKNYTYYWMYQSNSGNFEKLLESDITNKYQTLKTTLENINNNILNKKTFIEVEEKYIENINKQLEGYNYTQIVSKNKIYNVQINRIILKGIFKCSVYQKDNNENENYLGTASIVLTNKLKKQGEYTLIINNGDAAFQYNEKGQPPTSKELEKPQQIKALNFTFYDNLGKQIDSESLVKDKKCKVRWEFPVKDTMLKDVGNGTINGKDSEGYYNYYQNRPNVVYQIENTYDITKQRNQIKLFIDYKGVLLSASTNFSFMKTGQPGTNGTSYIVKLIPNTTMSNPPLYPMITEVIKNNGNNGYYLNYILKGGSSSDGEQSQNSLSLGGSYKFFNVQLWNNGEIAWKDDGGKYEIKPTVKWEILQNKYNTNNVDESILQVVKKEDGSFKINEDAFKNFNNESKTLANIVKCEVTLDQKTYYGTIPVTVAQVRDDDYRIKLKDYTGFRYVIYDNNGKFPKYDNTNPFQFICTKKQKIKDKNGDISDISKRVNVSQISNMNYTFSSIGSYKIKVNNDYIEEKIKLFQEKKKEKNQYKVSPKSIYDGLSVNNAITCTFKEGNTIIGKIYVPVHFLLDKHNLAEINEWDGNSIQINNDKGFILSPQVGAGKKQSDNSFSGVLIGNVKPPDKKTSQMGLFGYHRGERTIFLNSADGSARFGKTGASQIVIDPTKQGNRAYLYSGNYFNLKTDGSINYDSPTGDGMLIDLSRPSIEWGNKKFSVNENGKLISTSGFIGGWAIQQHTLSSSSNSITLQAGYKEDNKWKKLPAIYSGDHSSFQSYQKKTPPSGFYLSAQGLSIGSQIKIDKDGIMKVGPGAVQETGNYWTINGNSNRAYIAYGGTELREADTLGKSADFSRVYLGTDGISLGRRFSVTKNGHFKAYEGIIGGWTIETNSIKANYITLNSNGSIIAQGKGMTYPWSISSSGAANFKSLTASGGSQNGWSITSKGVATFSRIIANDKGNIAGWEIKDRSLYSKNGDIEVTIDSKDGSMYSKKNKNLIWRILSNGGVIFQGGSIGQFSFSDGFNGIGELGWNGNVLIKGKNCTFDIAHLNGIFVPWNTDKNNKYIDLNTYLQQRQKAIEDWVTLKLSNYVTRTELTTTLKNYVTNDSLSTTLSSYVKSDNLAKVATSGSYKDLGDTPNKSKISVNSVPYTTDKYFLYD